MVESLFVPEVRGEECASEFWDGIIQRCESDGDLTIVGIEDILCFEGDEIEWGVLVNGDCGSVWRLCCFQVLNERLWRQLDFLFELVVALVSIVREVPESPIVFCIGQDVEFSVSIEVEQFDLCVSTMVLCIL